MQLARPDWNPHVDWEYGVFALVGVMQGVLSACIVHAMAAAARAARRHSLFKPPRASGGALAGGGGVGGTARATLMDAVARPFERTSPTF